MLKTIVVLSLLSLVAAGAPDRQPAKVLLRADFDQREQEGFQGEYGGAMSLTDEEYSQGRFALRIDCGAGVNDVERYFKFTDDNTKVAFHYKAHGVRRIRVLGGSVEDGHNLYFEIAKPAQDVWSWKVVPVAEYRNLISDQDAAKAAFGDVTGRGKTFKNVVFHLLDLDKKVERPVVFLDNIVLYSGDDVTSPRQTGEPRVIDYQGKRLLIWPDARDDVGVAYYRVARGPSKDFDFAHAAQVIETVIPEWTLKDANGWYRVVAVDYDGNHSDPSPAVRGSD